METSPSSRDVIVAALTEIEVSRSVTVLYACESGSRAWGFESEDSDWDVRFIFVWPPERYLSIESPPEQIDFSTQSDTGLMDVVGWDLRKALRLLRKSNPSMLEWLHSPIVYRACEPFTFQFRQLMDRAFSPRSSGFHYASLARANDRDVLEGDQVVLKKYFYMLRAVLAFRWATEKESAPPVLFEDLLQALMPAGSNVDMEVRGLLERKRAGEELGRGPRLPHLHRYLQDAVQDMAATLDRLANVPANVSLIPSVAELDDFFQETVRLR